MQTQINAPLQALLQTAAMVTPDKQNSTVAAKVAQAAEQKMQAQAVPPGIAALLPGVQQQAAQAAQAAQPATQGDINQLRQMMAQAQQGQGVAQLPGADVQMAEGGVVGYAGPDGSDVELDVSGRIKKALRDWYERTERGYMERAGATPEMIAKKLGKEPPVAPAPIPEGSDRRLDIPAGGIVSPGMVRTAPAPRPPVQRPPAASPAAAPAAPMLPDTRESTVVNPSEAALQNAKIEGMIKDFEERIGRKPEESEAEKAYRTAAMAEYQRGIGGIDAARQRMLESQQKQKEMDLINYLSGMGGGRTLFSGMARSGQALSQAQQQREATRLAYEDKLDERRNIVENLKLATLQQDAERARAWTNELRKNEAEIAKLRIGLGEKRAGEFARAELSQQEAASRLTQAREEMASREKIAREETASRERIARAAQTGDIRKVFDTLQDNARAEFEKWEKSPEGASSVLKPGVREAKRAEFLEKQVALAKAAGVQGLDPLLTSIRAGANTGATVSPEVLSQFKVRPVGQ